MTKIINEEIEIATTILSASCTPVYLTIPVYDFIVVKTKEFTKRIKKTEFNTWSQLIALKSTFCWISIAIKSANTDANKSIIKIIDPKIISTLKRNALKK